jgi:hypothetical protein
MNPRPAADEGDPSVGRFPHPTRLERRAGRAAAAHADDYPSPRNRPPPQQSRPQVPPVLEPFFAVVVSFAQQERAANTARHAVVPTGDGGINQLGSSDRHRGSPECMALLYASPAYQSRSIRFFAFTNHHSTGSPVPDSARRTDSTVRVLLLQSCTGVDWPSSS